MRPFPASSSDGLCEPSTGRPPLRSARRAAALVFLLLAPLVAPSTASAQRTLSDVTSTPEDAAELFVRSVRAIRWSTAAQFMHPEALDRFRAVVTMIADVDSTGALRSYLTQEDADGYGRLSPAEVFNRAVGAAIDGMPGLMHAIYDRDDEILGHVEEASDTAHVVYRTMARISGAVSEVKVMQLVRTPDGWRVYWSDELETLDAALRGVARTARTPGQRS